jgi:hypothetical protein
MTDLHSKLSYSDAAAADPTGGMVMDLETREEQLRTLAERAGIDWKGRMKGLPDDPHVRVAALATLLGIEPIEAWRTDSPTKTLASEARKRKAASEKYAKEERELLKSFDVELGEET